ncbi:LysR substrate-binding domain-containing protein [Streptomyces sp. S.PNR 29]|uniref:LysR substrate-binding domain-containing protein n=1 Tax=Streptomyces sp. S.PNR 29 TaxID=2973805 RepID=UPI0025B08847|nr:LysR substrate-binding domain-containing protein [Streptomyces sp. S.PNR 29]MDN0196716.1 LysR substrate-binding domain-containing protein [Streptomyces sp. S.PNR 29]
MREENGRMDLQVLRSFQAVAEGTTVTDAAADARITQPALSRALKRLEDEVGAELFQRVGRGLRLTPAGRVFKEYVDATLDNYDRGRRAVAEVVDPDAGVVSLAFLHTLGTWLVPRLVTDFRQSFPQARFELHQDGEAGLTRHLLDATADLIITSSEPGHPLITWRRLLVEPLRLAVPARHRLARRHRIRLAEVAEERFILLKPGYGLRDITETLCREAGFVPLVGFEGEEVETLRGLVAAGLGVSLIPSSPDTTATLDAPIRYLEITDVRGARDIGIAWLSSRAVPPIARRFLDHAMESASAPAAARAASRA